MPEPHPHIICMQCRRIIDADLEPLSHLTESLAQATGFQILNHRVDFYGVCPACQQSTDQRSGAEAKATGRSARNRPDMIPTEKILKQKRRK